MKDGAPATTARPELFFDAIAGRYERAYALPSAASRQRIARMLAELPATPARVLDLGVGPGRELSALLDAGHAPTGVDVSPVMLERCARRARPVPLVRANFWEGQLPFADASFDAAIALHGTLAHAPDVAAIERLAVELARLVVAGGVFVAEAPSPAWIDRAEAASASASDRRVRRTGASTCVYEDVVAGSSIDALVLGADRWRAALAPSWATRVDALDDSEWFVVARRT